MEKLTYTRREAAFELGRAQSTIDVMIRRGLLTATRQGRRVNITAASVKRAAAQPLARIWPPRQNGKTTRHFAPQPPPPGGEARGVKAGGPDAKPKKKAPVRARVRGTKLEREAERSIA